jgi:hypothetical protein
MALHSLTNYCQENQVVCQQPERPPCSLQPSQFAVRAWTMNHARNFGGL